MSNDSTNLEQWAIFEDAALALGFTQIPNAVTRNPQLSMQAKYIYGLLLSYAWQDAACFPGLDRMRQDTGAKVDTIRKYLHELADANLIEVKRRGRGQTNLYIFKRLSTTLDHPQRGVSRPPSSGVVKTTPIGGYNEYAVNEDSDYNSPRDTGETVSPDKEGQKAKELTAQLCDLIDEKCSTPRSETFTGRFARDCKRFLKRGGTAEEIDEAIDRIVERYDDYKLSLKDAVDDVAKAIAGNGKPRLTRIDGKRKNYLPEHERWKENAYKNLTNFSAPEKRDPGEIYFDKKGNPYTHDGKPIEDIKEYLDAQSS